MVEPTLTDEEKTRLAFLAGCEFEYRTDPVTQAVVGRPKNPIGFQWDGQRWIVCESRDRRGLTGNDA
jgi:hypothetical protein